MNPFEELVSSVGRMCSRNTAQVVDTGRENPTLRQGFFDVSRMAPDDPPRGLASLGDRRSNSRTGAQDRAIEYYRGDPRGEPTASANMAHRPPAYTVFRSDSSDPDNRTMYVRKQQQQQQRQEPVAYHSQKGHLHSSVQRQPPPPSPQPPSRQPQPLKVMADHQHAEEAGDPPSLEPPPSPSPEPQQPVSPKRMERAAMLLGGETSPEAAGVGGQRGAEGTEGKANQNHNHLPRTLPHTVPSTSPSLPAVSPAHSPSSAVGRNGPSVSPTSGNGSPSATLPQHASSPTGGWHVTTSSSSAPVSLDAHTPPPPASAQTPPPPPSPSEASVRSISSTRGHAAPPSAQPPRAPLTSSYEARLATYNNWPHATYTKLTPQRLALAGFVFSPKPQHPDSATCVSSSLELAQWEDCDDPSLSRSQALKASGYTRVSVDPECVIKGVFDETNLAVRSPGKHRDARVEKCCGYGAPCIIRILGTMQSLRVTDCVGVTLLADGVAGAVHIQDSHNCHVFVGGARPVSSTMIACSTLNLTVCREGGVPGGVTVSNCVAASVSTVAPENEGDGSAGAMVTAPKSTVRIPDGLTSTFSNLEQEALKWSNSTQGTGLI